ncbi:MAG: D-Ala-D-Ala carboxypeptidase family metallohydrolase [Angustibacter sp.]
MADTQRPHPGLITRRSVLSGAALLPAWLGVSAAFSLGASAASASGTLRWWRTLREGATGSDVLELQIRVAGWAASAPQQHYVRIDGVFGPGTRDAVARFQAAYGLSTDSVAGLRTYDALDALVSADGSTVNFDWSEFTSRDGSGFSGGKLDSDRIKENVRRLMHKLEALRRKSGSRPVTVVSGFRSVAHNARVGGAGNSMHMYGIGADIKVTDRSTAQVYRVAQTCGFSGLDSYSQSWQHCDSRVQHAYGSQSWWWADGKRPSGEDGPPRGGSTRGATGQCC